MPAQAMGAAIPNNNFVLMSCMSGPSGSPLDAGAGTGALCTGIGYGPKVLKGPNQIAPDFTDDVIAVEHFIGGGRSTPDGVSDPWQDTFILGFGNGGSRDAGAGPAFTGFQIKPVTASGAVANGAAVEAGWTNRNGVGIVAGQTVFGSAVAASPAPT